MTIPFPGPAGITYPAGTLIDCGIRFDNQDSWTTAGAVPGSFDVQAIATHEEGHFIALSHSTVGQTTGPLSDDATMIPFVSTNNIDFRSLHNDDIASALRTYSRVNGLAQTTGGRGRIIGTLKKSAGCTQVSTGVSVRAYLASQGLEGVNSIETFSGSQFRQGLPGEPVNGSFELNVLPGGPYTIFAHTFENAGSGFYLAGEFNLTTNDSNTLDTPGMSQAFDSLATVGSISAGQTVDLGTVGILGCVGNQPPLVVSVTPSSGSGSSQTFSFLYSDPNGFADISWVTMLITPNMTNVNACQVYYSRPGNAAYLLNDAGSAWMGPVTLGTVGSLQNSQCILNVGGSSALGSGNNLTVNLALTFQAAFAGTKNIWSYAADSSGQVSGWQPVGTWTVLGPQPPTVVSVTPSSGSGSSQTFSFQYSDPNGFADISWVTMLITPNTTNVNACQVYYSRPANAAYLLNDAASAWMGPVTLGTVGSLGNNQCILNAGGSSALGSGNNLTVNLALTFQSAFAGTKNIRSYAADSSGQVSGWQSLGTWTVTTAPAAVSVTPSSGSGSSQTFSFLYSDPNGFADISWVTMLITPNTTNVNACQVYYSRPGNAAYLLNDAGSAWMGPVTLGTVGSLGNNQCILNVGGSSALGSGNNLTVNLALTFQAAFTGTKNIWSYAADSSGQVSGWQPLGTWTVP